MLRFPNKILQIFNRNNHYLDILADPKVREVEKDNLIRVLNCGKPASGTFYLKCPCCGHKSHIQKTCNSRFCNSCGKKNTDQWIETQLQVLPKATWKHITFTMPETLWQLFLDNRFLLGFLFAIAAGSILTKTKKKGITPGIFAAMHTWGRDLKGNVHIHMSVTCGGLTPDGHWKACDYHAPTLMRQWRNGVIKLLRKHQTTLTVPKELQQDKALKRFLDKHYDIYWHVWVSEASDSHKKNVEYLGRYVKRPPLAASRIVYSDDRKVVFTYYDHKQRGYRHFSSPPKAFMARLLQHIPNKHFRMIRYFGFLAYRVRGKLLPKVYKTLSLTLQPVKQIRFAELFDKSFGRNPLMCDRCYKPLVLMTQTYGKPLVDLYKQYGKMAKRRQFLAA